MFVPSYVIYLLSEHLFGAQGWHPGFPGATRAEKAVSLLWSLREPLRTPGTFGAGRPPPGSGALAWPFLCCFKPKRTPRTPGSQGDVKEKKMQPLPRGRAIPEPPGAALARGGEKCLGTGEACFCQSPPSVGSPHPSSANTTGGTSHGALGHRC